MERVRQLLGLIPLLLLAGCGEVYSQAQSSGSLQVDARGARWVAYQSGSGAWRLLTDEGTPPVVLPPEQLEGEGYGLGRYARGVPGEAPAVEGAPAAVPIADPAGRYGVASVCLDPASGNVRVTVQHATLRERRRVFAGCTVPGEAPETYTVQGRVRGLSRGEYSNIYLGAHSALVDASAATHRLELPAARYDLIAAKYGGDERVPEALVFEPNLLIEGDRTLDVDFGGPHAFSPTVRTVALRGTAEGELIYGAVDFVSARGTHARLGEISSGSALPYAHLPEPRPQGGTLRASAQSFSYSDRSKAGSSRGVVCTFGEVGDLTLRLPQPLGPVKLARQGDPSALRASWSPHPAGADLYAQFYSQIVEQRTVSYAVSQSSGWFERRPLSYALPDLSGAPGWQPEWTLEGGETFWDVSLLRRRGRRPQGGVCSLFAARSGVLAP